MFYCFIITTSAEAENKKIWPCQYFIVLFSVILLRSKNDDVDHQIKYDERT